MADADQERRLDVRGLDEPPFDPIMRELGDLPEDQTLLLINEFEPVPLYAVLANRGFASESEQIAENEWHVRITHE